MGAFRCRVDRGLGQIAEQETAEDDGQAGDKSRQVTDNPVQPAGEQFPSQDIGAYGKGKQDYDPEDDLANYQRIGGLDPLPVDIVDPGYSPEQGIEAQDQLAGAQAEGMSSQPADQEHTDGG